MKRCALCGRKISNTKYTYGLGCCYNNYRNLLQSDINTINRTTTLMNLHSCDIITLKQASEINKKYKENKDIFQKIINGDMMYYKIFLLILLDLHLVTIIMINPICLT